MGTFSTLLLGVRARIQDQLRYVRKGDVFITPDHLIMPVGVQFPAVGIKDGPMTYLQNTQPQDDDREIFLSIAAYVNLAGNTDELIIGRGTDGKRAGVVTLVEAIAAALKDYGDFDADGVNEFEVALPQSSPESRLIETDKSLTLIMRTLEVKYTKYTG